MQRFPIRAAQQVIEVVTAKKPLFAGIDPYNFYIDGIRTIIWWRWIDRRPVRGGTYRPESA